MPRTLTGMPAAQAAAPCEVRYDTGLPYADLDAESLLGAPGAPGLLTLGTMWQYRNHQLRCARFEREAASSVTPSAALELAATCIRNHSRQRR